MTPKAPSQLRRKPFQLIPHVSSTRLENSNPKPSVADSGGACGLQALQGPSTLAPKLSLPTPEPEIYQGPGGEREPGIGAGRQGWDVPQKMKGWEEGHKKRHLPPPNCDSIFMCLQVWPSQGSL